MSEKHPGACIWMRVLKCIFSNKKNQKRAKHGYYFSHKKKIIIKIWIFMKKSQICFQANFSLLNTSTRLTHAIKYTFSYNPHHPVCVWRAGALNENVNFLPLFLLVVVAISLLNFWRCGAAVIFAQLPLV